MTQEKEEKKIEELKLKLNIDINNLRKLDLLETNNGRLKFNHQTT
jgi:hypothetical protein